MAGLTSLSQGHSSGFNNEKGLKKSGICGRVTSKQLLPKKTLSSSQICQRNVFLGDFQDYEISWTDRTDRILERVCLITYETGFDKYITPKVRHDGCVVWSCFWTLTPSCSRSSHLEIRLEIQLKSRVSPQASCSHSHPQYC